MGQIIKVSYGKDARSKLDFSLVLKFCREFDDVTSVGKLFHVRAAATGNARSPTVDSPSNLALRRDFSSVYNRYRRL